MLREQPLVAVADAYARAPSLPALVLKVEHFQVGEVVGDKRHVQSEEMPLESLAKPIADFRVRPEVFHRAIVGTVVVLPVERIQARLDVQCPMAGEAELQARVEGGGAPIGQVGLERDHGPLFVAKRGALRVELAYGANRYQHSD